jgi:hypothetical protein
VGPRAPAALLAAAAVAFAAPLAAAQTAAVMPVRSADAALAVSVETAIKDAMIGAGYLLQSGPAVTTALGQLGLTEIATMDDGRRLGQALGAELILSASVEPSWISIAVMHVPTESIEVREGELPGEAVNVPATVVANLADAVRVIREAGAAIPEIPPPQVPDQPPPDQPPPDQPPPDQPPPDQPPPDQPPPDQPPPDQPWLDQPPQPEPEEPPAYADEGPFHVRVFPGFNVLLNEPARSGGSRVGGRVGLGFAYAPLPELDVGLELDLYYGLGTAIDVGAAVTYRFPISHSWQLAPHLALGYFQLLTGVEDAAFFLRASGDIIWTIVSGYALYLSPVGFTVVAGGDATAGLYELGLGFLGAF